MIPEGTHIAPPVRSSRPGVREIALPAARTNRGFSETGSCGPLPEKLPLDLGRRRGKSSGAP